MTRLFALAPLAVILVGCAAASPEPPKPTMSDARANCTTVYRELPSWVATLEQQSGKTADASTPCDNWVESQGEDEFVEFWTTPSKYLPYSINAAKVDALQEAGIGD